MKITGKNDDKQRPPIPLPIQRAVRQRCGFGCIFCGHPLYEYHHIRPYAEVLEHTEENITLLCDSHHREETNGLLTIQQVLDKNISPINIEVGISNPFALHFSGTKFRVEIGSNEFYGGQPHPDGGLAMIPISIDDIDIIWFRIDDDGHIYLYLHIFDECNLLLLKIFENALMFKRDPWDIEFIGQTLIIRQSKRNIFLELEFCPPDCIRILRGRILCNGVEVLVRKTHIFIINSSLLISQCRFGGVNSIGLQLGRNDRGYPSAVRASPEELKRYHVDRKAALTIEKQHIEKTKNLIELLSKSGTSNKQMPSQKVD